MSDIIQRAFNVGEVSEKYWLRNDLEWYNRSVRSLVNFIPTSGGALLSRPGTIKKLELSFKPVVIERYGEYLYLAIGIDASFLHLAMFDSDGNLLSTNNVPTATIELNGDNPQVETVVGVVPSGLTSGGSSIDLFSCIVALRDTSIYNQAKSLFYVSFIDPTWYVQYFKTSSFNLLAPTIAVAIPGAGTIPVYYQVSTVTDKGVESPASVIVSDTGDALAATNPATITWNEPAYNGFNVTKYYVYRVESGISRFIGDIAATGTGSAKTFIDYKFDQDINFGPVLSTYDSSSAHSDYTTASSICLHQQRLMGVKKNTYSASRVGAINSLFYTVPIQSSDSISARINGPSSINAVRSVSGELMFFTDLGIYVNRGDNTGALTPTSNGVDLRWSDPVEGFQPLPYKGGVVYLNKNYQLKFLARSQNGGPGYASVNLTEYTYEIEPLELGGRLRFEYGIGDLVWVRRNSPTTGASWRGVVINADNSYGWATYKTDGTVVAARDSWIAVERLVNGSLRYYVEQFQQRVDDRITGCYLDCAVRLTPPYSIAIDGTLLVNIPHLAGMTVKAVVDGLEQGPFTVSSLGQITLNPAPTSSLLIGLPYEPSVTTHELDLVGVQTLVRQPKTTSCAAVWFKNTASGEVRVNSDPWQEIRLRDESDGYGPIALKTGLTEDIYLSTSPRREQTLSIRQTSPFPMTIVAIARSVKGA